MLRRALIPCLVVLALPVTADGGVPAQASRSCDVSGEERSFGATYVTSISARGVSCGKAKGVVRAYHDCRGSKRACRRKVSGYRCRQRVLTSSPVQYDARVKCRRGGKRVTHTYSQNT